MFIDKILKLDITIIKSSYKIIILDSACNFSNIQGNVLMFNLWVLCPLQITLGLERCLWWGETSHKFICSDLKWFFKRSISWISADASPPQMKWLVQSGYECRIFNLQFYKCFLVKVMGWSLIKTRLLVDWKRDISEGENVRQREGELGKGERIQRGPMNLQT